MPPRSALKTMAREFDLVAPNYDRDAPASMPGYSDLHRALMWGIPFVPTRSFRVLELGVGTGTLAARILEAFPHATFTGIDLSPRMIARAREKLRPFRDRVELVAGDLGAFEVRPYDAVVSALAIQHLRDAAKWQLFRRIFRSLTPGGYFGDADDFLPEDPVFDSRYAQIVARLESQGPHGRTAAHAVWRDHEKFDHPATLTATSGALERAGFPHVGVPWRFFSQAVVWAYR